jgi:hypothetical protein
MRQQTLSKESFILQLLVKKTKDFSNLSRTKVCPFNLHISGPPKYLR